MEKNKILRLISVLSRNMKIKFMGLIVLMTVISCFETLFLAVLSFFASTVAAPDKSLGMIKKFFPGGIPLVDMPATSENLLVILSVLCLVCIIFKSIFDYIYISYKTKFGVSLTGYIGEELLKGFIHLPYEEVVNRNTADLILMVEWRVHVETFVKNITMMLKSLILVITIILALFVINYMVIVVLIVFGLSGFFLFKLIRKLIDRETKKARGSVESAHRNVSKIIHGIRDIKLQLKEGFFIRKFKNDINAYLEHRVKMDIYTKFSSWVMEILVFLLFTVFFWVIFFVYNINIIDIVGVITFAGVGVFKISPSVVLVVKNSVSMRENLSYISKILDCFDEFQEYKITGRTGNDKINKISEIKISHLFFKYEKSNFNILEGINYTFKAGESVGIIGNSGSGKSTLINLMTGLLKPEKGEVFINNIKTELFENNEWKKVIGYVSQDPYILDGSIAENISFGQKVDVDKVLLCCRKAKILSFIETLPEGIYTRIGEFGTNFSGGQIQRIAIARVLYNDSKVLFFDEATSALDIKTEREIMKTILSLKNEVLNIIVSHRLNSLKNCDIIIWLEDNKIKKYGRPEEILKKFKEKSKLEDKF